MNKTKKISFRPQEVISALYDHYLLEIPNQTDVMITAMYVGDTLESLELEWEEV